MGTKRYVATADNTIVNAFGSNLRTRVTGANVGQADVMEVYSIWSRQETSSSISTGSQELSRVLIKFPTSTISSDRTASKIPASGSVSWYLRMFSSESSKTVPKDFKLFIQPVSIDWEEGDGLDLENYKDKTNNGTGSNWVRASSASAWTSVGGDYNDSPSYVQSFSTGLEDVEVDITSLVEDWVAGTVSNYGIGVRLSASYEAYFSHSSGENSGSVIHNPIGAKKSYYTKRFFSRGSQYFFKRPCLEARWSTDIKRDDRGAFYFSSSLSPAADNLNTLYLYNYIRGRLRNIPNIGTGLIYVSVYSGSSDDTAPSGSKLVLYTDKTAITGGYVSTGIYTCSVALTKSSTITLDTIYDVWHDNSSSATEYFTGTIKPYVLSAADNRREPTYYISITNLQNSYMRDQKARFNLYVREKNWSPSIYTKATANPQIISIQSASYRVVRMLDGLEAVSHGTGSDLNTILSYDMSGNYFDLDMTLLEPGYEYGLKLSFYDSELASWQEQNELFKFRVEDYEY